jgi:type II secretory pathway pseudopilin PulG
LIAPARRGASLRDERGFTMVEMVLALAIGIVVILAAYALIDLGVVQSGKVSDRVDAAQRGRQAMDEITSQLRSQVCLDRVTAAVVDGQDSSVTFYAFTDAGPLVPVKHVIAYDPRTLQLAESDYAGSGTLPNTTFPAAPTSTRTLLTDVVPATGAPIFSYYAWSASGQVAPTLRLSTPLSAADRLRTVRTVVQFSVRPAGRRLSSELATFQDEAFVRTADANDPTGPGSPCK